VAGAATREALAELLSAAHAQDPRERAKAVEARLRVLEPTIASLVDPSAPGKGRALFATVAGNEIRRMAMQLPLPNRVVLADTAYLRPLAAALDSGHAAGIVILSRHGVRVLEWKLGQTEDVARFTLEAATDEWRMMKGPSAPGAWMAQQSSSQEDRYARRLTRARSVQLAGLGSDVLALAHTHGWDRLLVLGDERLAGALVDVLPERDHLELLRVRATPGDWLSATEVGAELVPHLEEARERHDLELIRRVCDASRSGGLGAAGLADVIEALEEGRVHQLLLDGERDWHGVETPDGRLFPSGIEPPGVDAAELRDEPLLADRLIERALKTDAPVSLVSGPAAEALEECGGVAAILRW
jgi:peptide subunit release factor 1 (eRF1)